MALLQRNSSQIPPAPEHLPDPLPEQPLTARAALTLTAMAAGAVLLFYGGCLLALLTTVALIAGCIVLMIGSSRLGLIGVFRGPLEALGRLAACIARSLSLRPGVRYEMPLLPEQAPRLFEAVAQVARRMDVPAPDVIVLEMSGNAWVHLRGYRRGKGFCRLGIGYDLLATLTQAELTAILAHEMAHARLIERGSQGWLRRGVGRICQTAEASRALARPGPKGQRFFLAEIVAVGSERLAKRSSRLLAAISRQGEFAADREAALLCGSALFARALRRVCLSGSQDKPAWRDRLAAFERAGSLIEWIRARQIAEAESERSGEAKTRGGYSTHPSLADRLAALPASVEEIKDDADAPAIELLTHPDALAGALIAELERVARQEEKQDSLRLHREVRKERRRTYNTPGEIVGIALASIGGVLMVIGLFSLVFALSIQTPHWQMSSDMVQALEFIVPASVGLGLGIGLLRIFRFREKVFLPIPALLVWTEAMEARDLSREAMAAQTRQRQEMERSLRSQTPSALRRRAEKAQFWARQAYEALEACDFVRAEAAAALALEANPKSVEAGIARGVTSAYFGDPTGVNRSLGEAVKKYGASPSVSLGLGWGLLMLGQYERAEAYLQEALRCRPEQATVRSLCGLCQWRQGKIHEATESFRQGLSGSSPSDASAHRLLLARILLDAGHPREAAQELEALGSALADHPHRLAGFVQAALLLGEREEAGRRAAAFEAAHPTAKTRLHLADLFAGAGEDNPAGELREQVAASGFYPEALLGLAYRAWKRSQPEEARTLLLSALDMTRATGPGGAEPLDMMEGVLRGLLALNVPPRPCLEWEAAIALPAPMPGMSRLMLRVAAPTPEEAAALVGEVYGAMRPAQDLSGTAIAWQAMPVPASEPVLPGVRAWRFS